MNSAGRKIQIGICSPTPGWEILLRQIGVPWKEFTFSDFQPLDFSLLVVNRSVNGEDYRSLESFIRNGGTVLHTVRSNRMTGKRCFVPYLLPEQITDVKINDLFDIQSPVIMQNGNQPMSFRGIDKGVEAYLGIDVESMLVENRTKRKNFHALSPFFPNEILSLRSKNTLRQYVTSVLELLHHQSGLPFVHKWYFPKDDSTIFTFRIDTDKGTKEQIQEIYELGERYQIPITWFLDVKSHEPWLEYFTTFQRQEIALHCYEHAAYPSKQLNKDNFEKALALLRKHSLNPQGITSPTGAWSGEISAAMNEIGFAYSSEFSYDYDNLPSFPFINNRFSSVLQLPVHPICIGSLIRSHSTEEEMKRYFSALVTTKHEWSEPICLYHHPTHGHNGVFENVFQYINEQGIRKFSYSDYHRWWMARTTMQFQATAGGSVVEFDGDDSGGDVWIRVSLPDSREGIFPLQERIELASKRMTRRIHPKVHNDYLKMTRSFDRRHIAQNLFDWWIKITE